MGGTIKDIILPKKGIEEILGTGLLRLRQNQKQEGSFQISNNSKYWDGS